MRYLCIITVFFISACVGSESESPRESFVSNEGEHETDSIINIDSAPERIISLSPSETEMICAAGACDKLIGRTKFCNYPSDALDADVVGVNPLNFEKVLSLSPDLIVMKGGMISGMEYRKLERLDIPVVANEYDSVKDVISNLRSLGKRLGVRESAEKVADSLQEIYFSLKKEHYSNRPKTLILISQDLYVHGGTSYATELIEMAGGRNAAGNIAKDFPRISREYLLTINPEIIITGSAFDKDDFFSDYPELQQLSAFRNDRLYVIDTDLLSRPGPRIFTGIKKLAELIDE